jgi:hypothetical protein
MRTGDLAKDHTDYDLLVQGITKTAEASDVYCAGPALPPK